MSKREPMKVTTKYATTRSGSLWLVESLGKRWTVWTCGMSCDCWTACDGRNRYMNPDGPTGSRAIAAVKSTLGLTSGYGTRDYVDGHRDRLAVAICAAERIASRICGGDA